MFSFVRKVIFFGLTIVFSLYFLGHGHAAELVKIDSDQSHKLHAHYGVYIDKASIKQDGRFELRQVFDHPAYDKALKAKIAYQVANGTADCKSKTFRVSSLSSFDAKRHEIKGSHREAQKEEAKRMAMPPAMLKMLCQ